MVMGNPVKALQVDEILDATTFTVASESGGHALLNPGDEVWVVAIQHRVGKAPLVLVKQKLFIESVSEFYAVARTAQKTETKLRGFLSGSVSATSNREYANVESHQELGNPARRPVKKGDTIIRPTEYSDFVKQLNEILKVEKTS